MAVIIPAFFLFICIIIFLNGGCRFFFSRYAGIILSACEKQEKDRDQKNQKNVFFDRRTFYKHASV